MVLLPVVPISLLGLHLNPELYMYAYFQDFRAIEYKFAL